MAADLTSIVILSYNTLDMTKACLESIREHTSEAYELIVIDNASTDGSTEYLRQQKDIRLAENQENLGFPKGCNQGMALAAGDSILLLNSDTVVTENWLTNLKKGLYSSDKVGAVGCLANHASNGQQIAVGYGNDMAAMQEFARDFNKSDANKWEKRPMLVGFCLLFSREAYQKIGNLDERFTPGNYEDNDYCLRILEAGYDLLLLKDTFIHHWGHSSFKKVDQMIAQGREEKTAGYMELYFRNQQKFFEKWLLPPMYVNMEPHEVREAIESQRKRELRLKNDKRLLYKAAVVIPVYKERLSLTEEISLKQLRRTLGPYHKFFILPEGLKVDFGGLEEGFKFKEFPREFFADTKSYSRLLLQEDFYKCFKKYEYILIHQLDAFVFDDRLLEFCFKGYDYIGAPCPKFDLIWHLMEARVGNGGLSLRKVDSCRKLLSRHRDLLTSHAYRGVFNSNEDVFFGYAGRHLSDFKVPDVRTALDFAMQDNIQHRLDGGSIESPFGIHGFNKIRASMWRDVLVWQYEYPSYSIEKDGDFRESSIRCYLRIRPFVDVQMLFGALKAGKPARALEVIMKKEIGKIPEEDRYIVLAYFAMLMIYAKHKEEELQSARELKGSMKFRELLAEHMNGILKKGQVFGWLADFLQAALAAVEEPVYAELRDNLSRK